MVERVCLELSNALARTPPARSTPVAEARALASALGVTLTLADWLVTRGHTDVDATRRFLNPRLAELTQPEQMADRKLAAERLARAIQAGETIAVFGDYDCDGMTSAAIMTELIESLGGRAVTFIASRFDGGYGLSESAVERVLASGASLLVTCDCGSSDHASLARVQKKGLDAIVIDHHLVPAEPLPVLAFLNPHRPECGFPYKGLASCGLALSIGAALRGALGKELDLRRWLDLVAIGTIADVAPLDGDNRALVRAGLAALGRGVRPGVRALLELAKLNGAQSLTAEDVAFRIAPRLNAPGRLGAPDAAVRLLLAKTDAEAAGLAAEVEQASLERRAVQDRMLEEALAEIAERSLGERPAIVLGREGWNHGIVGIVAGRLASQFGKPVVVAGFGAGHGRGSVRGPQGSRLFDALAACQEHTLRFGGHQAAAGVELRLDALDAFRASFEQACASMAGSAVTDSAERAPCVWLAPGDALPRVLKDLYLLEPCSQNHPAPDLALEASVLSAREVSGGHLKLELEVPGSGRLGAFGIGMGERAASLSGRVVVSGKLRSDRYRGGDAVELRLESVQA